MISLPEMRKKQIVFVLASEGDKLSFSNDNVVVKDKDGRIKHQSTCYKLFMLVVAGNTSITSGLIQRSKRFGFAICLMTRTMKVYQMITPIGDGNTMLRKKQYQYQELDIGRHIISNKISCQIEAINKTRQNTSLDSDAKQCLRNSNASLMLAESIPAIMGYEGAAAREYFDRMFCMIKWKGRKPRIKNDYLNATLDIGYNILFNFVDALLSAFGFDTYYGVLHRCFYHRKSLVCDIVEPMRPLIDLKVRKCINLGQIKEDDFRIVNHQYVLEWKNNSKYVGFFLTVIMDNKEDIFTYIQSYYRAFMKQLDVNQFPIFKIK